MSGSAGFEMAVEGHRDNAAVESLSSAMKIKLSQKRVQGHGGWSDKATCTQAELSRMLREHVEKGDPVDVANFCMMLHNRKEAIL